MTSKQFDELLTTANCTTLDTTQRQQVLHLLQLVVMQCAALAANNRLGVNYPDQGYAITNYYTDVLNDR